MLLPFIRCYDDDDDDVGLNVLGCEADILGTECYDVSRMYVDFHIHKCTGVHVCINITCVCVCVCVF